MRRCCLWVTAIGLLAGIGCGDRGAATRFVPAVAKAREALEAALDAWKDGGPPRSVGTAAVYVADSHRKPGQRLRKYTILGETPGDGPRCFAVRLSLESPQEEVRVRYVVFGMSPLWVYSHEDFQMLAHWECEDEVGPPSTGKAPETKPAHHAEKSKP